MTSDPTLLVPLVFLARATGVLLLAAVVANLLRRASAGTRHTLWLGTLALVLTLPMFAGALPEWRILPSVSVLFPDAPRAFERIRPTGEALKAGGETPAAETTPLPGMNRVDAAEFEGNESGAATPPSGDLPGVMENPPGSMAILLVVWALGASLVLMRLARSALSLRRILSAAEPLTGTDWNTPLWEAADRLDLAEAPRLLRSDRVAMPFACGLVRPAIVLPTAALEWSAERRRAVLFHELAHIRRRDLLGHSLGRLACALYWMHPLVWTAARRLRAESERACDDLVLSAGTPASEYADHLLQILVGVRGADAPAVSLPMGRRREFEGRMLAILDSSLRRRGSRVAHAAVLMTLCLGAFALMAMVPAAPAAPPLSEVGGSDRPGPPAEGRLAADAEIARAPHNPEWSAPPETAAAPLPHPVAPPMPDAAQPHPAADPHPDPLVELGNAVGAVIGSAVGEFVTGTIETVFGAGPAQDANLPLLIRLLNTDESADVRRTAAWGLAGSGNANAESALAVALQRDPAADVREMAAWALAGVATRPAHEALMEALLGDPEVDVRGRAAWSLGRATAEDAGVVDALSTALSDDSEEVRHLAAWAIGTIHPEAAPRALYARGLTDTDAQVRLLAAWALGEIVDPAAAPALAAAFARESDPKALEAMTRALVFLGPLDPGSLTALLESEDAEVRAHAVRIAAGASGGSGFWPWPWPWPEPRPHP